MGWQDDVLDECVASVSGLFFVCYQRGHVQGLLWNVKNCDCRSNRVMLMSVVGVSDGSCVCVNSDHTTECKQDSHVEVDLLLTLRQMQNRIKSMKYD